jgi:hypothetical protein
MVGSQRCLPEVIEILYACFVLSMFAGWLQRCEAAIVQRFRSRGSAAALG